MEVETEVTETQEQTPDSMLGNEAPAIERPEWLMDKYVSDDRSQEDSINEQAKAYKESQKMLGGFTGAPDAYELSMPEGIEGDVDTESDLYKGFIEYANESNMSNEAAQQLYSMYVNDKVAQAQSQEVDINAEMETLGPNAGKRIQAIDGWSANNLSQEEVAVIGSMAKNADQVMLLEKIIGMSKNSPLPKSTDDTVQTSGYSEDDFRNDIQDERYHKDVNYRNNILKKAGQQPWGMRQS